jgi:hypothetical protein
MQALTEARSSYGPSIRKMARLQLALAAGLLTLPSLISSAVILPHVFAPLVCPTEVIVSLVPIVVITSILSNTVVTITPGVTLTVTNAPSLVSTLTTATITSTALGTIYPSGPDQSLPFSSLPSGSGSLSSPSSVGLSPDVSTGSQQNSGPVTIPSCVSHNFYRPILTIYRSVSTTETPPM